MGGREEQDIDIKTKGLQFYIAVIIVAIILSISISWAIIYFGYKNAANPLLEGAKMVISILGPTFTILVFYRSFEIQEVTTKKQEKATKEQKLVGEKEIVHNNFYNLLSIFGEIQRSITSRPSPEYGSILERFSTDFSTSTDRWHNPKPSESGGYIFSDVVAVKGILEGEQGFSEDYHKAVEKAYDDFYAQLGPYFKTLHRLFKIINQAIESNIFSKDEYKTYRGVIGSQISSAEYEMIFYNSTLLKRGCGFGVELVGTDFFGDTEDLKIDQHFAISEEIKEFMILWYTSGNKTVEDRREYRSKYNNEKGQGEIFAVLVTK